MRRWRPGSTMSRTGWSARSTSTRSSGWRGRSPARPGSAARRCRRPASGSRLPRMRRSASSIRMWCAQWRAAGAELVAFSPLADEAPDASCDACWLPGGYPELHAGRLAAADGFREGLRRFAETPAGAWRVRRVHGAGARRWRMPEGVTHAMAGLLGHVTSFARRRMNLGYREARLLSDAPIGRAGEVVRGHEFHYSRVIEAGGRRGADRPRRWPGAGAGAVRGAAGAGDGDVLSCDRARLMIPLDDEPPSAKSPRDLSVDKSRRACLPPAGAIDAPARQARHDYNPLVSAEPPLPSASLLQATGPGEAPQEPRLSGPGPLQLVVIGIGPGNPEQVTIEAIRALNARGPGADPAQGRGEGRSRGAAARDRRALPGE